MNKPLPMHLSPRCRATSKRTKKPCKAPALTGWKVCRFHGARGGAPSGPGNGSYRHGLFTNEAIAARKHVRILLKRSSETMAALMMEDA